MPVCALGCLLFESTFMFEQFIVKHRIPCKVRELLFVYIKFVLFPPTQPKFQGPGVKNVVLRG